MRAVTSSRRYNRFPTLVIAGVLAVIALHYRAIRPRPDGHRAQGVTVADVQAYFPSAAQLVRQGDTLRYRVTDHDGNGLGSLIDTTTLEPPIMGYAGPVPCAIALSTDDHILGIALLDSDESPSFLDYVAEIGFLDRWTGMPLREAITRDVDAVSGATLTTAAIIEAVRRGGAYDLETALAAPKTSSAGRWKAIGCGLTLAFGLLSFIMPRALRRYRPVLLVANVVGIGYVSGKLLSLAQLQGWLAHGIPLSPVPVLAVVGCAALLLPLLTGRDYYCTYVCPFGSAQDLVSMVCRWRRPSVPRRMIPVLHALRLGILLAAMATALGWLSRDLTAWEPFAAFQWRSAPHGTLLIAGIALFSAVWVPRFWCRTVCPTGCILDTWRPRKPAATGSDPSLPARLPTWALPVLLLLSVLLAISPPAGKAPSLPPPSFTPSVGQQPPGLTDPLGSDNPYAADDPFSPSLLLGDEDITSPGSQRDVLAVIHSRKSVRNYTDDPVTTENLQTLLRAGMAGPTAGNAQPWAFVAVTERERMRRMADGLPYGKMLDHAGAAIVVCGVPDKGLPGESNDFWVQDCSAAAQTILLAAEGMGLGAVWVGVYPLVERLETVRTACAIPASVVPLCVISIGHPMGIEQAQDKYRLDNIHWNAW